MVGSLCGREGRLARAILHAFACAAVAACSDASGPKPVPVSISVDGVVSSFLTQQDASGWPNANCELTMHARAKGSGTGTWKEATFRWFMGVDRAVAVDSATVNASDVQQSWGGGVTRLAARLLFVRCRAARG